MMRIINTFSVLGSSVVAKSAQIKQNLFPAKKPVWLQRKKPTNTFRRKLLRVMFPSPLTALVIAGLAVMPAAPAIMASNLEFFGQNTGVGCMALNLYRERATKGEEFRRNSSDEELIGMGLVVKNRLLMGFRQGGYAEPASVCDVVWMGSGTKAPQFSWTNWPHEKKFMISEKNYPEFVRSFHAAVAVMTNSEEAQRVQGIIGSADHYLNEGRANPAWKQKVKKEGGVGYHTFYSDMTRNKKKRKALEASLAAN